MDKNPFSILYVQRGRDTVAASSEPDFLGIVLVSTNDIGAGRVLAHGGVVSVVFRG